MLGHRLAYLSVLMFIAALWASVLWVTADNMPSSAERVTARPHLVDEAQCRQCHLPQVEDWQGSHHQLAMLAPAPDTVLGDFNNTLFTSDTETTHFLQQQIAQHTHQYRLRTPDGSGQQREFTLAYTFGWSPLQQYLLALDDGRLQASGVAWDTEKQEWFHLYDGQGVDSHHALHWSKPAHNANTQCIECHTTGYQPGYDPIEDRFDSQWHAAGITCQGCHGPASDHLRWTAAPDTSPTRGFALSLSTQQPSLQLEVCGRCHSRRTPLGDPTSWPRLEDAYLVSPLTAELYEVDGKIKDEVFEYGSFLQSRMHQAGVLCSDCHNAHSGRLRLNGNAVCTQCHNPGGIAVRALSTDRLRAAAYDDPSHHHHAPGSAGSACVACHMPGKVYMGNDLRHDHSFSSPNPAQALALGHSDACLSCHNDRPAAPLPPQELIAQFEQWYPDHQPRDGGYAEALAKARQGKPGAAAALLEQLSRTDLPGLRRAALLAELPAYPSRPAQQQLIAALEHPDAPVRRAAIEALAALDPLQLESQFAPLLTDPVRAVRITAAEQMLMLAEQSGRTLAPEPFAEYEQAQKDLLANAEAWFNLANLYRLTGRTDQVAPALEAALRRNPAFAPAVTALAQWREFVDGQPAAAHQLLEQARSTYPNEASLHYALGLAHIRAGQLAAGVSSLEQAHHLQPDNETYTYVLAVAWYDTGRREQAVQLLREQLRKAPPSRLLRLTLLTYLPPGEERAGLLEALRQQNPEDPALAL